MNFSLRQLTYIESAAKHQSIAAAASAMRISKSSIAAAIDNFEETFELQLFVRQPSKGLILTPAGKRLMGRIRDFIQQAHSLNADLSGETEEISGEFTVGCFAPLASQILPFVIQSVTDAYPQLTIRVLEGDLRYVNNLVHQGEADLVLTYDLGLHEGTQFEAFGQVRPHAVVCESDPMAGRDSISLMELSDRPMILLDLPESTTYFETLFRSANFEPNIVYRTGSYQTLRSFVSIGLGYSILNLRFGTDYADTGKKVICVPLNDTLPTPKIGIHRRADPYISPAAKAFTEECRKLCQTFLV